ncbi:MAG: class I SAM-dependent methyltransferase [Byssovorax sp.]
MVKVQDLERDEAARASYGAAATEHFTWQTRGAYVAEQERELCAAAFLPLGSKILDLGCGEGATLFHLGEPEGAVGVDLFEEKVALARKALPRCRFVAASALDLPFEAASFDHVLVRDVIHHIPEPQRLIDEVARVLAPGGRVDVLEPCRYNPLIAAHGLALPVERGELRSTEPFLRGLLREHFRVEQVSRLQALPLHRILLHPTMGKPSLGANLAFSAALAEVEHLAARLMPKGMWAYMHLRALKR